MKQSAGGQAGSFEKIKKKHSSFINYWRAEVDTLYGLTQQSGKQKQNQVIQIKNLNLNIANLTSGSRVNP